MVVLWKFNNITGVLIMNMLPVPLQGLPFTVRRVSLQMLQEVEIFETDMEWARRVLPQISITRRNVLTVVLSMLPFLTHNRWFAILKQLCLNGKIGKRQILSLYRLQSEAILREQPIIFLKDLHMLCCEGVRIFTDEEIIKLASTRVSISSSDVEFLLRTPHLRDSLPVPLLKAWVSDKAGKLSVLNRARIARRLSTKKGESMDLETLCTALYQAAEFSPSSGAVQIFFMLLYSNKETRTRRGRDKARETLYGVISKMVLPLSSGRAIEFHAGQKLLGWYLTNPFINQDDKDWMERELKFHTDAVARCYSNFIKDAKKSSPTAIED